MKQAKQMFEDVPGELDTEEKPIKRKGYGVEDDRPSLYKTDVKNIHVVCKLNGKYDARCFRPVARAGESKTPEEALQKLSKELLKLGVRPIDCRDYPV